MRILHLHKSLCILSAFFDHFCSYYFATREVDNRVSAKSSAGVVDGVGKKKRKSEGGSAGKERVKEAIIIKDEDIAKEVEEIKEEVETKSPKKHKKDKKEKKEHRESRGEAHEKKEKKHKKDKQ